MPSPAFLRPITQAEMRLVEQVQWATQSITAWDPALTFDQQIIRAGFLRALLCGQVPSPGSNDPIKNIVSLRLIDALIVGRLDLSECKDLPHLSFEDSVITGGIALRNARAGGIHLLRCAILRGIDASGLHSSAAIELKLVEFTHRTVLNFSEANIENGCSFSELTTVGSAKATETLQRDLDELVETLEAATAKAGNPTRVAHKFGAVPNPRHLVAKAWSTATALTPTGQLGDFAFVSLKAAHIGGDLTIEGIRVSSCNHPCGPDGGCDDPESHQENAKLAIDAERIEVKGDVSIRSTSAQLSILRGGISLVSSQITGYVNIEGVGVFRCASTNALDCEGAVIGAHFSIYPLTRIRRPFQGTRTRLRGGLRLLGAHIKGQLILRGVIIYADTSIIGDGVIIDNDFVTRPEEEDSQYVSLLCGRGRFPGATIGGQFKLQGTRVIVRPQPATHTQQQSAPPGPTHDAVLSMRDITIKGGLFFVPFGKRETCILGGVRLNDSVINGVFEIVGSRITAAPSGDAVDAIGANIKSDLLFASVHPDRRSTDEVHERCQIEGVVHITGATLGGRLRIVGANLSVPSDVEEFALVASGASIKGGIFIEPASPRAGGYIRTTINGGLRMNQIQVGSRFQVRGATIEASPVHGRIAIIANGAHFAGDVTFGVIKPADDPSPALFEVRNYVIKGEIRLYGTEIKGGLKCYVGTLHASPKGSGFVIDGYTSDIAKGVVFTSSGENAQPMLDIRGIVGFAYAKLGSCILGELPSAASAETQGSFVSLQGHVRLNGAEIVDVTSFERVLIGPLDASTTDGKDLAKTIDCTLNRWNVTSPGTIISAQNADLGTMLSIRLDPRTSGTIDLLGAHVYTLDDHDDERGHGRLGWGDPPTSVTPAAGVMLRLFGFTYTHIMSDKYDAGPSPDGRRPLRLAQRIDWLHQQYENKSAIAETYSPLPYMQLASVFRAQGFNREADDISYVRRKYLVKYGTLNLFDKFLQRLYGFFFGFGYRSEDALATCLILLLVNIIFALLGNGGIPVFAPPPAQNATWPWLVESQHPTTGPFDLNLHPVSVKAATTLHINPSPSQNAQTTPASPNPPNACRCVTHKRRPHHTTPPPPPPPPAQLGDTTGKLTPVPAAPLTACSNKDAVIYAIDQTLPLIHVTSGNGCEIPHTAPKTYYSWHILMLFLSWIVIPTAGLTLSGILRETTK